MNTSVFIALVVTSSLWSISVAAAPSDVLITVTGSDAAKVDVDSEYFLKKHRYFAKRHRLVRFNGGLLESNEEFVIPLFDDESITVAVTSLEISGGGSTILWSGRVTEPSIPIDDLIAQGMTPNQAKSAHSSLFRISFAAIRYEYDEVTRTSKRVGASNNARPVDGSTEGLRVDKTIYYQVDTQFLAAKLGAEFRLIPLEMSPKYHILIEVDENKRISEGPFDDPENPAEGLKRRQYRDYMESLGPDPRSADDLREKTR